ncbi:MAG: phospho-N-acetylmuramoyl-pentapeptide-transferase [Bacillota bacterium]|nr:phospho-N-acetylmuramoyl-pentapeptide-transferase [Bacillota bacterium]MDW7676475.1 phospho-N-acetylmuramoyl-pentapeptide-transferase [Bacillota bacterium]
MLLQRSLILVILLGFLFSVLLGPVLIPVLKKINAGQSIRQEGPESHLVKQGTPTMGGFIFILAAITASLMMTRMDKVLLVAVFSVLAFAAIGLMDDYIKVVLQRSMGLRAYQKLIMQFTAAGGMLILAHQSGVLPQRLYIPYLRLMVDLGWWMVPFFMWVIVGTVNSVNLTDGLDGLAAGTMVMISGFFSLVCWHLGLTSLAWFSGALSGACLGFLVFNIYPARVFMGDTGSLALGGALSAIALMSNMTLLLPVVGGIFFAETLSVILQVAGFKLTRRRLFKMSPLHHHFELSGWSETRVVTTFWGITLVLCLVGILGIP